MKAGWTTKRLGEVCAFDKDQGIHRGLPYVGMEHIESHTGRFIGSRSPQAVKSATFRFSSAHVLYGRLRPYLNKAIAPDFEGHCSTEIFPIKPSPAVDRHYLLYWLLADETTNRINETCSGARMPRADMNEVLGFEFPLPPLPEQRRIVALLDEAFAGLATAAANAERNLDNARELFESHLAEVFSRRGDGWVETTLGECTQFIDYRGKTPIKTKSGLRLITAKNVKKGYLQRAPEEFVAPDSYSKWMTRGIPERGDVIFTTEAPLANVALLDTDERVVFAQRIIVLQPDRTRLDGAYLKYMLQSAPLQASIHAHGTGATVQGIKASLLKNIPVCFPAGLGTQTSVVRLLDALFAESQRLGQSYLQKQAALAALKRSLLHQAFNGEL